MLAFMAVWVAVAVAASLVFGAIVRYRDRH
jgi:hypothetical protein